MSIRRRKLAIVVGLTLVICGSVYALTNRDRMKASRHNIQKFLDILRTIPILLL